MGKKGIKEFMEDLKSNSSLKKRLEDLLDKNSKLSDEEKKGKIVEFANKEGYDVNVSDLNDAYSGELNDDDLFNVAGGRISGGEHGCYTLGSQCSAFFT